MIFKGHNDCFSINVYTPVIYTLAGVAPNPQVTALIDNDQPSFQLEWSPPFLWPGYPIDHCLVSVISKCHSNHVCNGYHKKIISNKTPSFTERGIMSFNKSIDDLQRHACIERTLVIMAFNRINGFHNRSVSVTGRYPSGL